MEAVSGLRHTHGLVAFIFALLVVASTAAAPFVPRRIRYLPALAAAFPSFGVFVPPLILLGSMRGGDFSAAPFLTILRGPGRPAIAFGGSVDARPRE